MLVNANYIKLTLNGRTILQDVGVHIGQGEIYGLLGPNGAGKSTTIAVLLGLYEPDAGDVQLFDQGRGHSVELRGRIGVMPERAGFYEWMSAQDYLAWYASFYGGLQQPVADLLHLVGLGDSGGRAIGQFSRGMQQRLAVARALVDGPELLILDEPTNGLDPRGRREIHDLLLRLAAERNVGILLCTHLLDDVERLCGRIGIIQSLITNTSERPVEGLVAWISLVEVTPGQEQPVDLEDWSAHKAVAGATLAPGAPLTTDWPIRLIQSGDYRVVISTTDRNEQTVYTSPTLQFHVARKPVVESSRILPVALGLPLLIAVVMVYRGWRKRRHT